MLIGCLEWEFLKNGLKSDVNTKLKSYLRIEIDFRNYITPKNINFYNPVYHSEVLEKIEKSKHFCWDIYFSTKG